MVVNDAIGSGDSLTDNDGAVVKPTGLLLIALID